MKVTYLFIQVTYLSIQVIYLYIEDIWVLAGELLVYLSMWSSVCPQLSPGFSSRKSNYLQSRIDPVKVISKFHYKVRGVLLIILKGHSRNITPFLLLLIFL